MENIPTKTEMASELRVAHVVYLLQALSFFLPITALIGVILNYVKRSDVKEAWLLSHYKWQIETFWFWLLGVVIGAILIVILIGYVILALVAIWAIYRIVKGWLRLTEQKAV